MVVNIMQNTDNILYVVIVQYEMTVSRFIVLIMMAYCNTNYQKVIQVAVNYKYIYRVV